MILDTIREQPANMETSFLISIVDKFVRLPKKKLIDPEYLVIFGEIEKRMTNNLH